MTETGNDSTMDAQGVLMELIETFAWTVPGQADDSDIQGCH